MELVIDRSKWLRGQGSGVLLRADGMKCCLGFYALACGFTADQILGRPMLSEIASDWRAVEVEELPEAARWLVAKSDLEDEDEDGDPVRCTLDDSTIAVALADVNDKKGLSAADREGAVAAKFAAHGVTVRFVDGPVQP